MLRANPLYVLVGAAVLFFLYLIIFGGPDLDEARRKREAKKTKNLVEKIVESAQKKDGMMSSLNKDKKNPSGLNYGMDTSSDIEVTTAEPGLPGSRNPRAGVTPLRNPLLSGSPRRQSPGSAASETVGAPPTPATQPSAPSDGYYPPPAQSIINKNNKGRPSSAVEPAPEDDKKIVANALKDIFSRGYGVRMTTTPMPLDEESDIQLTDRQRGIRARYEKSFEKQDVFVAFEGSRAYLVNEDGTSMPMPDGYYEMPKNGRKILIRDGEKVVPN